MSLKVASWNCTLGLINKIDVVETILNVNKIDVLFLQETEIKQTTPINQLKIPKYNLELSPTYGQKNSRTCCYINSKLGYNRLSNVENKKVELIIIESMNNIMCGYYRPFLLPNHANESGYVIESISTLNKLTSPNMIIMGDFNIDYNKLDHQNYRSAKLYNEFESYFIEKTFVQLIKNITWQRKYKNSLKTSILDHIYTNNLPSITDSFNEQQPIGDHNLIGAMIKTSSINYPKSFPRTIQDWSKYSKQALNEKLSSINFDELELLDVESHVSELNQILGTILDNLVPTMQIKRKEVPGFISVNYIRKRRKRKNYYKKYKKTGEIKFLKKSRDLEKELKKDIQEIKKKKIRSKVKPGDTKTLWQAVNMSMNNISETIPEKIIKNDQIAQDDQSKADMFCEFFNEKVCKIIENNPCNRNVYNGKKLIQNKTVNEFSFDELLTILKNLPLKNCSGIDRIPLRFFNEGKEILGPTIFSLMNKIWISEIIPEVWKITKTQPLYKSGNKSDVNNYRPISNLCSMSKIFEKLVQLKLNQIAKLNDIDLTNKNRHGFKSKHSTTTAMLELQHKIAKALDNGEYATVISLDLSAAFDVVDHRLLIERLKKLNLPDKIVKLLQNWLKDRSMYVNVNDSCSILVEILAGTLQGSCLGPTLFALFISPMYDLTDCITYADDNYTVETGKDLDATIGKVKKKVETIMKWLKDSGMQVNSKKTEFCIFYRFDPPKKTIQLYEENICSKNQIKILGVTFDSKLTWFNHIQNTILKCKKTLQAIKLIARYFTIDEKLNIVTSLFYSRLYYGAEVWLIPTLNSNLKSKIQSISTQALRVVAEDFYCTFNSRELHLLLNRFTPFQMTQYISLLNLYRTINNKIPESIWIDLQFKYLPLTRSNKFLLPPTNKLRIGMNSLSNRLSYTSTLINNDDLNKEYLTYKLLAKKIVLEI